MKAIHIKLFYFPKYEYTRVSKSCPHRRGSAVHWGTYDLAYWQDVAYTSVLTNFFVSCKICWKKNVLMWVSDKSFLFLSTWLPSRHSLGQQFSNVTSQWMGPRQQCTSWEDGEIPPSGGGDEMGVLWGPKEKGKRRYSCLIGHQEGERRGRWRLGEDVQQNHPKTFKKARKHRKLALSWRFLSSMASFRMCEW